MTEWADGRGLLVDALKAALDGDGDAQDGDEADVLIEDIQNLATTRPMTVGQLKNVLAVGKQLPRRRAMTARTIAHEALTVCPACDKPIIAEAAYDLTLDAKDEDDYGWIPLDDNEEDE